MFSLAFSAEGLLAPSPGLRAYPRPSGLRVVALADGVGPESWLEDVSDADAKEARKAVRKQLLDFASSTDSVTSNDALAVKQRASVLSSVVGVPDEMTGDALSTGAGLIESVVAGAGEGGLADGAADSMLGALGNMIGDIAGTRPPR